MLREHAHTVLDGAAPRPRMDLAGFHACSHSHCTAVKVPGLVFLSTWRAQWSPAVGIRLWGPIYLPMWRDRRHHARPQPQLAQRLTETKPGI